MTALAGDQSHKITCCTHRDHRIQFFSIPAQLQGNFAEISPFAATQRGQAQSCEPTLCRSDKNLAAVPGACGIRRLTHRSHQRLSGQHAHRHRTLRQFSHHGQTVFFHRKAQDSTDVTDQRHGATVFADHGRQQ